MVRAYVRRAPVVLPSGTNTGAPIRVVIDYDGGMISAYRITPVQLRETILGATPGLIATGPVEGEAARELERYFTEEPIMKIRKTSSLRLEAEFEVDFEAGLQRGRIVVGKDELCKKSQWPNENGQPYLKWIGLKCTDPAVKEWLK